MMRALLLSAIVSFFCGDEVAYFNFEIISEVGGSSAPEAIEVFPVSGYDDPFVRRVGIIWDRKQNPKGKIRARIEGRYRPDGHPIYFSKHSLGLGVSHQTGPAGAFMAGRLPKILYDDLSVKKFTGLEFCVADGNSGYGINSAVRPGLRPSNFSRYGYGFAGSGIGLTGKEQRPHEKRRTKGYSTEGPPSSVFHALSGFIHSVRSISHSILGDKIVLLPIAGLLFAGFAGFGAFIVFDDLNRDRNRQRLGRLLLYIFPAIGALCLLLGLQ